MIGARCKNHLIYFIAGLLSGCIVTFFSTTHRICAVSLYHPIGNGIKLPSADSPSPLDFNEDHHEHGEDDEDQFAPIAVHKHEGTLSFLCLLLFTPKYSWSEWLALMHLCRT